MGSSLGHLKTVDIGTTYSSENFRRMIIVPKAEIENLHRFMAQLEGSVTGNLPPTSSFQVPMPLLSISLHPHLHPAFLIPGHQIIRQVCHQVYLLILFVLDLTKSKWQMGHCPPLMGNDMSLFHYYISILHSTCS